MKPHARKIKRPKTYRNTSLSEKPLRNLEKMYSFFGSEFMLVGTASNYVSDTMRKFFGEMYNGDIDIGVPKEYWETHTNAEDELYARGFVKGAVTEQIDERRRRILKDSYVLMKFGKDGKEIDILTWKNYRKGKKWEI